jgi:catecholate siderophore receptor
MSGADGGGGDRGAERKTEQNAVKTTLGLLPLIALSAALTGPTFAQEVVLDEVNVEGGSGASGNTLSTDSASATGGRLPGTVKDIPQTVNVVPQEVLQQQKATTLEQALRNVPGVTMRIGEGGGGLNGDQFMIRGFEAKGDIYTDGLRDIGVRVRDAFAYEDIQVLKGGSSETFGMGTTGGAINARIKKAHLGDENNFDASVGTGPFGRAVIDVNRQISETSAFRFVGMGNLQTLTDRDHVDQDGAGALATASFGINTDLQWDISYLYQYGDRRPDYGVPMIARGTASIANPSMPITEFGVARDTFYGKKQDHDITNSHALTSNVTWEAADNITVYNDTRLSYDTRDFATTVPSMDAASTAAFFAGDPNARLSGYGGGNPTYEQDTFGVQNVSTMVAEIEMGGLRHQFVAGIDMFYQENSRDNFPLVGSKTVASIWNPDATYDDQGYSFGKTPSQTRDGSGTNFAVFASDRVWFTPEVSLLAGVRWDYLDSDFHSVSGTTVTDTSQTSDFVSPKASLIWEPTPAQTYYLTYSSSVSAVPGQFVSNDVNSINAAQPDKSEERNHIYEVGTKISVLDGKLGLTGAIFQVDKDDATYTDPTTGDPVATGEKHRARGVEIGVTGQITDVWNVTFAYAYIDTEILESTAAANIGNKIPFASENSLSLWTAYEIAEPFSLDGKLTLGGGITYSDGYFTNSANTGWIPDNFSLDAFASYQFEKFRVSLNGYNLTDNLNYSTGWGNRAVVAPGRSFVLSAGMTF